MTDAERLAMALQNRSVPMASPTGQFIPTPPLEMQPQTSPYNPIGIGETALSIGTGAIAQPIASIYGVGSQMFGGDGKQAANKLAQALTYQPTTEYGQATSQAFGEFADKSGLTSLPPFLGLPAPRMGAGAAKFAAQEYGTPLAEKGLSMYEQGKLTPGMKPLSELEAWHGSPHDIKGNFDIAKVGTGEGNQAYGEGMYFGQARGTGEAYRRMLVDNPTFLETKTGKVIDQTSPEYADLIERRDRMQKNGYGADFEKKYKTQEGYLYKVDIPDEQIPMMLDWDKPLSQQPKEIQKWLSDPYNPYKKQLLEKDSGGNEPYGKDLYNRLANLMSEGKGWNVGNKNASKELNSFGITGIRYLDEGSRGGTEKGTSNFVVFKPETVKILEKNDVPVTRKELLQQEFDKLDK